MNFYLKDPNNNQPSVTLTLLVSGFIVCLLKLAFSGLELSSLKLAAFTGGDFATSVGALGALYWARRNAGNDSNGSKDA